MAKAEIDRPDGTKITIEGTPEEVARTVHLIEGSPSEPRLAKGRSQATKTKKKRKPSIKDLVLELRDDGFFAEGKSLSEVKEALQLRKGYRRKTTSISKPLTRLVRDGELRRTGVPRKYTYFEPN